MALSAAEALGDGSAGTAFSEMGFSIEQSTVTAKSRGLKAEYSMELAQDLKAIHGLDAETELSNILSSEIQLLASLTWTLIPMVVGQLRNSKVCFFK